MSDKFPTMLLRQFIKKELHGVVLTNSDEVGDIIIRWKT